MEPTFQVLPPVPPPPPPPQKSFQQNIGGWIAAGAAALYKFKFLLGSLKTVLSMLFVIWIYTHLFGWVFAVGIVILIFVHEMGHVIAAKWLGVPITAPLFIPFVGALITMKQNPRDVWTEALMAYGGPLAGCAGSWICLFIADQFDLPWLMAIASISFFINLFNMIPLAPLDGGRICAAVSPWFWLLGFLMLSAALFFFQGWKSIVLCIIILVVAIPRIKQTLFGQPSEELQRYYQVHLSNRLCMALMYLGLVAALLLGYWHASESLSDALALEPVIS